jgi:hypothetical protein
MRVDLSEEELSCACGEEVGGAVPAYVFEGVEVICYSGIAVAIMVLSCGVLVHSNGLSRRGFNGGSLVQLGRRKVLLL